MLVDFVVNVVLLRGSSTPPPSRRERGGSRSRCRGRFSPGFTLLELLIVLAVVAVIAALVAPRIGSGEGALFRAQVREAVAALNYARRTAIIQGRPTDALLQTGRDARSGPGRWVSRGASLDVKEGPPVTDRDARMVVTFFPEGGSSGGELTLALGGRSAVINVDPITGRVKAKIEGEAE